VHPVAAPERRRYVRIVEEKPDYEDLVEGLGDMIYTLDLNGRFTYINSAGLSMLGYEPREILGHHFTEVLTDSSAKVAREHFQRGLEGTESTPFFEVQAVRSDGTVIDVEVRAGSLYRGKRLIGRQGVARDISALKQLQAEVAEKSQRLALLEDQARTAMDLYRRIADLTLNAPQDPTGTERALKTVEGSLARATAERMGLSRQDLEVIELLAEGCSNPEIARRVHLSPHTVKDRVRKLMGIFGAHTRVEVVAKAARHGLIGAAGEPRAR
jgi:PAS domain S-box-containing protein